MLRCVFRFLYTKTKTYSLQKANFCRPEELAWLKKKYQEDPLNRDKFQYLRLIQAQGTLGNFYYNKPLEELKEQELYFLTQSKLEYHIKREKIIKIIRTAYFKCFFMKEFHIFIQPQFQRTIIAFNQEISQMPVFQIAFCLEIINEFRGLKEPLDLGLLEKRLLSQVQSSDGSISYQMILISGYLLEMQIKLPRVINQKNLEHWINHNNNFNFGAIYFIHKLSDELKMPISNEMQQKFKRNMKLAIRNLKCSYFESNYIVFLLKNYPEYAEYINLSFVTSRAYTAYLNFYIMNRDLKIPTHKIPHVIIQKSNLVTFGEIIESRMTLGLDNSLTLAKDLASLFTPTLEPINAFVLFIRRNRIMDPQIQYYMEKAITKKLNFPDKNIKIDFQQFDFSISGIITMLSNLSSRQLCSVSFWRRAVKFIEQLIQKNEQVQLIPFQNNQYINLLQLVTTKNFKEETREIVFKKIVVLLRTKLWEITNIMLLTKMLSFARIGEDAIWILIEKQIEEALKQIQIDQRILCKIVFSFNVMKKGSYQMWNKFNDILVDQIKQEIIVKINVPGSLAKSFLKYKNVKNKPVDKLL